MLLLDRIERGLRSFLSVAVALILGSIATICFIEVVRRPFGESFVWYDEFIGYLLVWLTFFGAVLARSHRQHIGVDNLLDRVSPRIRSWLEITSHALMVVVHIVLLAYGAQLASRFLNERAITVDIPVGFVYLVIPISASLMLIIEAIHIARRV